MPQPTDRLAVPPEAAASASGLPDLAPAAEAAASAWPASAAGGLDAAVAVPAEAARWTLDTLRDLDPVLGLAGLVIVAVLAGDLVQRLLKLPRLLGWMAIGLLAGPPALRLMAPADLDPWKPLIDLAMGVLLFELGSRLRPRWLIDNPGLALQIGASALAAGGLVGLSLVALGAPAGASALVAAVAMSSSPLIAMALLHASQPRGQVTERLLMASAFSSVLAVLAVQALTVLAPPLVGGAGATAAESGWLPALLRAGMVLSGSVMLGLAAALALDALTRPVRDAGTHAVLQLAMLVVAALLAGGWKFSPMLTLLVLGMAARARMGHRLSVAPQLGSAGAALGVLLFVSLGLLSTLDGLATVWPWVLAIVLARALGLSLGVLGTARLSGLGWRQAGALALALQSMTPTALLLGLGSYAWTLGRDEAEQALWQALMIATTLMQLLGPVLGRFALAQVAGEVSPPARSPGPRAGPPASPAVPPAASPGAAGPLPAVPQAAAAGPLLGAPERPPTRA
ncbi:cation:proton antiporter [Piscinibacter sp. Jin2]|uniref:Cation:proton antiporter n=1 Tax=Aquariibacter lacus TaxID=2801332 RepID=A0A9X0XJS4_9BURK|nr:cation:proton antiporter [Piscinibacter lacus]MBL0720785.1 cation:proton antiporter [Piscinibacter lacus]